MLSQQLIFSALEQESNGEVFTIAFDDVWESFGYQAKSPSDSKLKAKRYIVERSQLHPVGGSAKPDSSVRAIYKIDNWGKIFFTVDSYKFALARAGTKKGEEYLWHLIDIERQYRKQLERQLTLTASDVPGYPHDWIELWQHSGIANKYHVRDAITRDFIDGKHYHWEGEALQISKQCYLVLMLSFRSKKGVTVDLSDGIKQIDWKELSSYEQRRKANTRLPKRGNDNGQLSLFN